MSAAQDGALVPPALERMLRNEAARDAFPAWRRKRRGWVVRRSLLVADMVALPLAFATALLIFGTEHEGVGVAAEVAIFAPTLPFSVVAAKLQGLYDRDEERTDHSTVDEFAGVFHVVTAGAWVISGGAWLTGLLNPDPARAVGFWALAVALVTVARGVARAAARRHVAYLQNTVIVGAGEVGQLVARKVLQHPEYGLNLVGFVDEQPRARRPDLGHLTLLGAPADLPNIVTALDVERVVVAFSNEADAETMALVRSLRDSDVQIDVVPRLFDVVGPKVAVHTIEGLPLVGLPPARMSRSSRLIKRGIDVVGASLGLLLTAPLFAVIAWRIKRDSEGPVFFRQKRLGHEMREFTALKFRTMRVDTDDSVHRRYIAETVGGRGSQADNGLFKLDRSSAVTPFGRWLRKTSLDELPQLINVLRGDMSLVGPRPCIEYETEHFEPHQFERFLVPAGITGLWQVTARAHASFGEALDMDVAYVRGWSLGLDLRLLLRTPFQLLRQRAATA